MKNGRWYVMKSKAGHYWATLRDKKTGALIARSRKQGDQLMKNFTVTYTYQGREYQANFPAKNERWAHLMAPLHLMADAVVLRVELAA